MIEKKLKEFEKLLEEGSFFQAHEVLEEVWFRRRFEDDNEIKLLKGFINASVSFELFKRGKKKQSKRVWLNYLKYRQLLFKLNTTNYNLYFQTSRKIDKLKEKYD